MNILYLIFIYPIELLIELVFQLSYWRWENCGISLAAGFFRQEIANPSSMCSLVRERYVVPVQNSLRRLIAMAVDDAHEQCRWADSIWSQLCVNVLRDSSWDPLFRPADVEASGWSESVADFVYRQVVAGMKFKARRRAR